MADKKISEMATASAVDSDDNIELSHSVNGGFTSVKASILAIATKILTGINFTSALETSDKTVIGAINEAAQGGGGGGASELDDLDDVEITNPTNGQVLKYNSQSQEWENANESGGGHTILDNEGTALAQEDDLQFVGTYSEDDSTNGKTVVNITREMTTAEYNLLSADERVGIIRLTDDDIVCDADEVSYDSNNTVKDKIDSIDNELKLTNVVNLTVQLTATHLILAGITNEQNQDGIHVYISTNSSSAKKITVYKRENSTTTELYSLP